MSDHEHPPNAPQAQVASDRLDSWKEIAAYLKRDVTTVRRWEKREGLPVHRHRHEQRESVYAFANELDSWWESRRGNLANGNGTAEGVPSEWCRRRRWTAPARTVLRGRGSRCRGGRGADARRSLRMWPGGVDDSEYRFAIFPPEQTSFGSVSLSPNGRYLAFTASTADGPAMLFLRSLDAMTSKPLPGTDGAAFPFWSPSSDEIGFFAGGQLRAITLSGCDASRRVQCPRRARRHLESTGTDRVHPAPRGSRSRACPPRAATPYRCQRSTTANVVTCGRSFSPTAITFSSSLIAPSRSSTTCSSAPSSSSERKPPLPSRYRMPPTPAGSSSSRGIDSCSPRRSMLGRLRVTGEPIVVGDDVLQQWNHRSQDGLLGVRDRPSRLPQPQRTGHQTGVARSS